MTTRFVTPPVSTTLTLKNIRRKVRLYERRYEMPSAQMATLLKLSCVRETAEVLKWMQTYHALILIEKKTRITGTHLLRDDLKSKKP